ncbi:zinc-binding alcohol dehydrogenase [Paenibacillus sp. HWE-109]|uniref:zinc-dependent alcohol dehydrogenase n=1 Tax=Paenibacillus sp. HWE-109 TaxID=1306526 RepID=UPI001EE08FC1|nr:zinc-binding alcohol dehydrogenase [Paenibacillus sp. HWE-109]UKS28298.1 zinc-binding alcohol dehydrogenase [Paenibacillus sp. HWE-109]
MKAAKSENGQVAIIDSSIPELTDMSILVQTEYSALSSGTELMVVQQKINTFLGYSATGLVREVGSRITDIKIGQRIACYGVPTHAEFFVAHKPHVSIVPEHVDPQEAAFAGIATIAIQALRQADLRFGESVVVLGLGLLGQMVVQIAQAAAYHVIGADLMEERCAIAEQMGIHAACRSNDEVKAYIDQITKGKGVDCVIICASSKTDRLIDQGLAWIRDRGKIVILGDTDTEFDRNAMFYKEAQITISRAGGPGRYDESYEKQGHDYPYGFVRWTMNRNLGEFIRLLSEHKLNIKPLITGIYKLEEIENVYAATRNSPQFSMGNLIAF